MTLLFGLLLLVGPIVVLLGAWLVDAMHLVRRLTGRGEIADVADEKTRALIDGDSPLPLKEAVRVNNDFADLLNSSPDLKQFESDLKRFYVIGDER